MLPVTLVVFGRLISSCLALIHYSDSTAEVGMPFFFFFVTTAGLTVAVSRNARFYDILRSHKEVWYRCARAE